MHSSVKSFSSSPVLLMFCEQTIADTFLRWYSGKLMASFTSTGIASFRQWNTRSSVVYASEPKHRRFTDHILGLNLPRPTRFAMIF